jgi:peptidoglycan/LPS O-acetylase OafA/YrhL
MDGMTSTEESVKTEPLRTHAAHYIAEIEGLRGIALSLVVLFHIFGAGRVSGGIDVFLVISGYLLTRSITRKIQLGEPFLGAHFSRVIARLVPSAVVVIAFVAVATWVLSPASKWLQIAHELIASILYFENWELISSQLAYGAAGVNTSPLQHFWSLSVQAQFFLVWPFLLIAVSIIARARDWKLIRVFLITTASIAAASFVYSVILVSADQSVAYLSTWARVWEMAVGALIALGAVKFTFPEWVGNTFAWIGLTLIASCGFIIDGATAFPGVLALWPVLGAVLVLIGAGGKSKFSPVHLLETRPLRFLARISYPLYLWHWPLLIFYIEYRNYQSIEWEGAAAIFGLSLGLAWLTQRLIAEPMLIRRPRISAARPILMPAAFVSTIALVLAMGVGALEASSDRQLAEASTASANHPGALALTDGVLAEDATVAFVPAAEVAERDIPDIYERGCVQSYLNEPGMEKVLVCVDEDAINPVKRIVMSGGSHVLHWYPALKAIALQENWQIDVVDKDGCRLGVGQDDEFPSSPTCEAWNVDALATIIKMKPDAVFTIGTRTPSNSGSETFYSTQVDVWKVLDEADIPVIAMRDTPRFSFRVPQCVEAHDGDPTLCSRNRSELFLDRAPVLDAVGLPETTALIDLSDSFCAESVCEAIVGNVLVYRDDDHMTATYSRTLAPSLRAQLKEQARWLF